MRLMSLELQRFGKFTDKTIVLPEGLYLWQDLNESGKTTTADFICFMFFGFEKSRARRALLENPLEKYQPWDSAEGMAGALEFEEDGKCYRIERTLNAKGKGEVRVLDEEGRELDISAPGEHFLGVDGETFINIFYIRQGENSPHRTAGMDVAMKNLMTTGSEDISFDTVMKYLQAEKAKYSSPKRGMGKLKNLQEEMGQLERSVAYGEAALKEKRAQLQDPERTEAQINEMNDRLAELQGERDRIAAHKAFLREQKRAALQKQLEALSAQLAEDVPSDEETGLLYDIFREMERASVRRERAAEELSALEQKPVKTDEKHKTVLRYHTALGDNGGKVLAIIGALMLAAGAVGALWSLWTLAGALTGGVLLLVGVLKMRLPAELRALGIRSKAELMQALSTAAAAEQATKSYDEALTSAQETLRRYEAELQSTKEKYQPLLQRTGVFTPEQLEAAQGRQASRRMLSAQYAEVKARLQELSPAAERDRQIAKEQSGLMEQSELEQAERQAEQSKEILLRRLADNAALAATVRREETELAALKDRLAACGEEYEKCSYLNEVAVIAIDAMEKAQQELRDNYAPALREKVERTLSLLTDGKYDTVTLDAEFSMRIKADGGLRALDYFSQGTRDAAYLALRLSLAEIVQGEKSIPLIFDDPFLNFDDERRQRLSAQLQKLGERQQILFFTCRG